MKGKLLIFIFTLIFCFFGLNVLAETTDSCEAPKGYTSCNSRSKHYVGVSGQLHYLRFKKDHGEWLFPRMSPRVNLHFGTYLTDNVSLEVGYALTKINKSRSAALAGEPFKGHPWTIPHNFAYETHAKFSDLHFDIMGRVPLADEGRLRFLGGIGLSFNRLDLHHKILFIDHIKYNNGFKHIKSKRNTLRTFVGSEYMYSEGLGIRVGALFNRINKMKVSTGNGGFYWPKKSIVYSIGHFIEF